MALVATCALVVPAPAGADEDAQDEQSDVRAKSAQVDSEIDALRATDAEVESALAGLDSQVQARRSELVAAQAAVDQAVAAQDKAERDLAAKEDELAEIRDEMRIVAVEAYVRPKGDEWLEAFSSSDNLNDTVKAQSMLSARSGSLDDLEDEYQAVKVGLERARDEAAAAEASANDARTKADDRLAGVQQARSSQAALAADVDQRINARLAEAASLEAADAQLSTEIRDQQTELAAKLPPPSDDGGSSSSGGGGGGGGAPAAVASGPSRPSAPPPAITGSGEIVSVGGIRIHASIAGNLRSLLSAASAAGINLGGVGYRDSSGQIATRRANCGTSDYAIYQMPASQCHPPTAIPGTSQHERGLAIDFTANGGLIRGRGDAAFQWLAANAGSYGFRNLPSEPWHWSTTGN